MDSLTLLGEAREAGLQIDAKEDHLIIRGPKSAESIVHKLAKRKGDLLRLLSDSEVERRTLIFRAQISKLGVAPFMHLPEAQGRDPKEGECFSCAGTLPDGYRWRCPTCQAAVWVALGTTPPPQGC